MTLLAIDVVIDVQLRADDVIAQLRVYIWQIQGLRGRIQGLPREQLASSVVERRRA